MSTLDGSFIFRGDVFFGKSVTLPDGTVTDGKVKSGANISADKLKHRHVVHYAQAAGVNVASETKLVHRVQASGTIKSVEVFPLAVPSGDYQYTVDVQKAASGGSFATVLDAVVTVDSTIAANTNQDGAVTSPGTVSAGDAIEVIVAASGTTGSQGQGFGVAITIDENGV